MGVPPGELGERALQQPLPGRMERIRAKQEKYHQERLPRGTGEGQDEARPGESRGGPSRPSPPSLSGHSKVTVTPRRRLSRWSPMDHCGELPSLPLWLAPTPGVGALSVAVLFHSARQPGGPFPAEGAVVAAMVRPRRRYCPSMGP